jgi:hypothetical protein
MSLARTSILLTFGTKWFFDAKLRQSYERSEGRDVETK